MRKCRSCSLCCTLVAVDSIGKKRGKACDFLCDKGCSIYGEHPKECANFWCLWLNEALPIDLSPLATGVVLWTARDNSLRICQDSNRPGNAIRFFAPWISKIIDTGFPVLMYRGSEFLGQYQKIRSSNPTH